MSDRHSGGTILQAGPEAQQVLSTARPEEDSDKGDGWTVVRALLLILGGIAIVSYVLMTVDG